MPLAVQSKYFSQALCVAAIALDGRRRCAEAPRQVGKKPTAFIPVDGKWAFARFSSSLQSAQPQSGSTVQMPLALVAPGALVVPGGIFFHMKSQ